MFLKPQLLLQQGEFFKISHQNICLPHYRRDAPRGVQVLLTDFEYQDFKLREAEIEHGYQLHLAQHEEQQSNCMDFLKLESPLAEPIPSKQFCEACGDSFKCYLTHVSSVHHQYRLHQMNNTFYVEIDRFLEDMRQEKALKEGSKNILDYYSKQMQDTQSFLSKLKKGSTPCGMNVQKPLETPKKVTLK